jgi:hypothetical protein
MAGLAGDAELLPRTHSEEDRQLARALALSVEDADLLAGHVDFAANPLRAGGAEASGALAAGFVSDDPGHGTRCKGVCVSQCICGGVGCCLYTTASTLGHGFVSDDPDPERAAPPEVRSCVRGVERNLYRVGPHCETWPNTLTENPSEILKVGPRFGPNLYNFRSTAPTGRNPRRLAPCPRCRRRSRRCAGSALSL